MNNGCICCTVGAQAGGFSFLVVDASVSNQVRKDLIDTLKKIKSKSCLCRSIFSRYVHTCCREIETGKKLDCIIIETTGLADPAPVCQTFLVDDDVSSFAQIDAVITVVDAKHILQHLDETKPAGVENESVEQCAFADRFVLNKIDLVRSSRYYDFIYFLKTKIKML